MIEALSPDSVEINGHIGIVKTRVDAYLGVRQQITGHYRLVHDHQRDLTDIATARVHPAFVKQFSALRQIALYRLFQIGFFVDHHEFEASGLAEQGDSSLGILDPRQLNQNPATALQLQGWLADSELVDPVTQGFQGLAYRIVLDAGHLFITNPITLFNVAVLGGQSHRFEVRKVFRHQAINLSAGLFVIDGNGQALTVTAIHPFKDYILLPQQSLGLIDDGVDPAFHRLISINPQHQMHAALQVETKMDGIKSLLPPRWQTTVEKSRRQRNQR